MRKHTKDDAETKPLVPFQQSSLLLFKLSIYNIERKKITPTTTKQVPQLKSHEPETGKEWSPFDSTFLPFTCHH